MLADAARAGICRQYTGLLERCESLTDFLRLYRRGADWALENNVPSLDMLRRFSEERLDLHGIFIDRTFDGDVLWDRQVYILRNCKGTVRTGLNIEKRLSPIFYLSDGCDITFTSANAEHLVHVITVPVYTYGGSVAGSDDTLKLRCTIHK